MRFPKNVAYAEAKKLGATIAWGETGSVFTIDIDAPRGKHWSDGAVHSMRVEGRPTSGKDRDDLFIEAIKRMAVGLEDCDLNETACADNAFGVD